MTSKVVTVMFDNATQLGTYDFRLDVPWPSTMTLRQVTFHNDGNLAGAVMIWGSWLPDDGRLAVCRDGSSIAPQTKYVIRSMLQGTQTIKVFATAAANTLFAGNGEFGLQFEFCPLEKAEEKKSS